MDPELCWLIMQTLVEAVLGIEVREACKGCDNLGALRLARPMLIGCH